MERQSLNCTINSTKITKSQKGDGSEKKLKCTQHWFPYFSALTQGQPFLEHCARLIPEGSQITRNQPITEIGYNFLPQTRTLAKDLQQRILPTCVDLFSAVQSLFQLMTNVSNTWIHKFFKPFQILIVWELLTKNKPKWARTFLGFNFAAWQK